MLAASGSATIVEIVASDPHAVRYISTLSQSIVISETAMTPDREPIKRARHIHMLTAVISLALAFWPCRGQSLPKIRMAIRQSRFSLPRFI
jgi:hypothetical protein